MPGIEHQDFSLASLMNLLPEAETKRSKCRKFQGMMLPCIFRPHSMGPLPLLLTPELLLGNQWELFVYLKQNLLLAPNCTWMCGDVQWCPGKGLELFLNYTSCKLISLQLNFDKQLGIGTGSSSQDWIEAGWLSLVSIVHLSVDCVWPFLWISWETKAPMPASELTLVLQTFI